MNEDTLRNLGYDPFVQGSLANISRDGQTVARVIDVNKNRYTVSDGSHEQPAELTGRFLHQVEDLLDFPTVGDWVSIQAVPNGTSVRIHSVLPRKTLLKRKESGKRIAFQLIAANIDFGMIVQPANQMNYNLLDRYFISLNESDIQPVVIISKTDLVDKPELEAIEAHLSMSGTIPLFISNQMEGGTDALASRLVPGRTYCLLGQSGVGKSSLLNRLLGSPLLEVGDIREKDGKGRHTTVRRQLVTLPSGSLFIDTPGIRELGNFQVEKGLDTTFDDLGTIAQQCRFGDCSHTHEQGCAILAALEAGEIDEDRYQSFLKLKKESEFYDMSYQDKRKKGKDISKLIKNFKKVTGRNYKQ